MHRTALALLLACSPLLAAENLQPLFDGKSLDGWIVRNGTATYVVDDGAILGTTAEGSPNSFLSPPKEYGDFILEFEVLVDPRMNSGVQIRSHEYAEETTTWINNGGRRERTFPKGRVHGYQVEISNEEAGKSGGIFDEARRGWVADVTQDPAASKAYKDNEWNHYRVEAKGDHIRVWLNGVPAADLVDPLDQTGFLGFQVHAFKGDTPGTARWRNVKIQDLGRHSWKPIFNASTQKGWSHRGGGKITVENGVIRLSGETGGPAGFYVYEPETFGDFTMRLEYKAVAGNSGVFFRAIDLGKEQTEGSRGYEIDVAPADNSGGLQEPGKRPWVVEPDPADVKNYFNEGGWNQLAVSAHGDRIVVHVNGTKTVDLRDPAGPNRKGRIALQINSRREPVEMYYRNIEILRPE